MLEDLHSFFMRLEALLLMVLGKSICSIPPMAALRLFSGSELLKGSLRRSSIFPSLESLSGHIKRRSGAAHKSKYKPLTQKFKHKDTQ